MAPNVVPPGIMHETRFERGPQPNLTLIEDDQDLPPEGLLLSSLPDYDTEVKAIEVDSKQSRECDYGDVIAKKVTMDDNTQYDLRVCIPSELKSDTAVVAGTAWWTHPELEHNKKDLRSVMRLGYVAMMVGPPSGWRAGNVSLSKAVYDFHRIQDIELEEQDIVRPDITIPIGSSRAGMMAIGATVDKYSDGRKSPFVDSTAPCVPEPFKLSEWPFVIGQLGKEAWSGRSTIMEYAKRGQLLSLAGSVLPDDPSHIPNAIRILPGLVSGEAGKFIEESDKKAAYHVVEFEDDYWAQDGLYEQRMREHGIQKMKVSYEPGAHVEGIARVQTRRDRGARLDRLSEIRGFDGSFDKVDFENDIFPVKAPLPELGRQNGFGLLRRHHNQAA